MHTYFDSSHPHFSKFKLVNSNTIAHNSNNGSYHITSPNKIDETFSTFTYKVIKTASNRIIYGIGSNQLKNDQTNQQNNAEFIGYYGWNDGYVYD
jgi:hypothetical protein